MPDIAPIGLFDAFDITAGSPFEFGTIGARGETVSTSFSAVWRTAHKAAGWFQRHGITRVAFVLESTVDVVASFLGALLAGATVVSLPAPGRGQKPQEYFDALQQLLVVSDAELVVAGESHALLDGVLGVRVVPAGSVRAAPVSGSSGAQLWQSTSGSTGRQRLARLTLDHLAVHAEQLTMRGVAWAADMRSRSLSWLPLPHDLGLHVFLLLPLYRSARIGYSDGDGLRLMDPRRFISSPLSWLEATIAHGASFTGATSSTLARCARLLNSGRLSGPLPVRFLPIGGEMAQPAALAAFAQAAAPYGFSADAFMPGYGSAETVAVSSFSDPGTWSMRHVALAALDAGAPASGVATSGVATEVVDGGEFLPGVEYRLNASSSGGEVGELELRGPTVMLGYAGEPDRRPDEWYGTSDFGMIDGARFFPLGRSDDLLKVGGEFVLAWEVERIVAAAAGVKDAVAVTGDDGYVLLVEPQEGVSVSDTLASVARLRGDIVARVRFAPARVVAVAPRQLPKTSSGKAQRALTAHLFRAGGLEVL